MFDTSWYERDRPNPKGSAIPISVCRNNGLLLIDRTTGKRKCGEFFSALQGGQTHGAGLLNDKSGITSSPEPGVGFGGHISGRIYPRYRMQ